MRGLIIFLSLGYVLNIAAQGSALQLGNPAYQIIDRLEILTGMPASVHTALKPYTRGDVLQYAMKIDSNYTDITRLDEYDLQYIYKDNNEWLVQPELPLTLSKKRDGSVRYNDNLQDNPRYYRTQKAVFNTFYKTPANFLELNEKYVYIRANPILDLGLSLGSGEGNSLFRNLRGFEIRGGIDDRIYFYTSLLESQEKFPEYINQFREQFEAIPQQGLLRPYRSEVFNTENAYDLLNGQAYIGFNVTPHVGVQFGHGRNIIGNGYRSVLLSDFSQNYLYLKLNWKVWKFHYQNIFAELNATSSNANPATTLIPKKYMAAHYFNYNITKNFSLGLFEAIIFNRDSEKGQFELHYLNPVILYRTAEVFIDSPDNVLLGFNSRWNFLQRFQLYGQFVFDTFKFSEWITNDQNWWGKKYGAQLGLKYINAFNIDHLDLQAEYNVTRPYTYAHRDSLGSNYSHNNLPLAHPLGANFREYLFLARYKPFKKWTLDARYMRAKFGEDSEGQNWGSNILLPYDTRVMDFGNLTTQGVLAKTHLYTFDLTYTPWHNLDVALQYFKRIKNSQLDERDLNEQYIGINIRLNIGQRNTYF